MYQLFNAMYGSIVPIQSQQYPQLTHYHFCCFAHEQLCTTFQLAFLAPMQPPLIRGGLSRRFQTLDGGLCIRSRLQWLLLSMTSSQRSISLQQTHSCAFVTRLTEQFEHEHLQNKVKNSSNTRKIHLYKIIKLSDHFNKSGLQLFA